MNLNNPQPVTQQPRRSLRDQLTDFRKNNPAIADDWLKAFYSSYSQRFLSDNNRIWSTAQIMIPLSLAGFAALTALKEPQFVHLLTLALVSSAIMIIWLVIAENHRAFQDKSLEWLLEIEKLVVITDPLPEKRPDRNFLVRLLTGKGAVRKMRFLLTFIVLVMWAVVLKYWPRCA